MVEQKRPVDVCVCDKDKLTTRLPFFIPGKDREQICKHISPAVLLFDVAILLVPGRTTFTVVVPSGPNCAMASTNPTTTTTIFAFDFDGVILDSAKECGKGKGNKHILEMEFMDGEIE